MSGTKRQPDAAASHDAQKRPLTNTDEMRFARSTSSTNAPPFHSAGTRTRVR